MAERPAACPEWRDDLAGWLVAQLPPEREADLAEHLATCAVCRAEADSLLAVTAVSLAADPAPVGGGREVPSAELGDRIAARVAAERRARRVLTAGLVAVASAAAAIVVVIAVQRADDPDPIRGAEVAFTVVPPGAAVDAVIGADDEGSIVQLTASGLDPDVTYALWLSPPDGGWEDRVAAGTFRPDEDGEVDERLRCALPIAEYGRAWATTPEGEIALDTE